MHNQNKFQKFPIQAITYSLGSITVAIGLFVLIGWQFDIGILKSIIPNAVPMRANAAAAFVLSGLALIFLQKSGHISRALVRFLAAIVLIVGFLTCCEYLVGWDLGIDEILFSVPADIIGTPYPSRMAPTAALNFMLLGFAFIVITFKKYLNRFIVLFSVTFSITVSVIGLVGYATGLLQMTEIGAYDYTKMAVHAASAFIILSIGILLTDYKRQRAPITIDQKLFAGLTSIATIIIFISILSVSSIQSLLQASEWVKNTQEVRNQIGAVLSHVIEVQSGDRGFVLTGDDNYLVAHNKALDELPTLMNNIRSQTADNPRQQKILASLEKLVGERMALSKRRIFTRRTEGEAKARLLYPIGIAKMITDSIRVIVAQMLAEEGRLMQTRSENETHLANRNQLIIYVSIGAQVLLLVFIFFVVRRDVVGRKKAEEKLRKLNEELEDRVKERTAELAKSEERYRSTLENLMEGCQIIDFDYRYKYVNDAATKQGRTSKEDLLDHTMMEKYPGIEKSEMFDKLRKCMIERVRQGMENEFIYPDGSKAWFDLHMEPVPEGAFILSIDITERKKAEEELLISEQTYRGILDSISEAVYIQDENGYFLDVNLTSENMYGYKKEYFVGRTPEFLSAPGKNDLSKIAEAVKKAFNGEPQYLEFWGLRKDGTIFPKDVSLTSGKYFGRKVVIAIARDITERKQAEEVMRKKDEHHRDVIENIFKFVPEGLLVFTKNLSLMKQNKAFEEIVQKYAERLSYTEEELAEKIIEQLRGRIIAGDTTEIHITRKDQ